MADRRRVNHSLAACAQSPIAKKTAFLAPDRSPTAAEHNRSVLFLPQSRTTGAPGFGPLQSIETAAAAPIRSNGIASFYTEGQQTANGGRFDPYAMTDAHRTLPFGTKLRVTNITARRPVTVRVNAIGRRQRQARCRAVGLTRENRATSSTCGVCRNWSSGVTSSQ
jgi:rare lipoprotein A